MGNITFGSFIAEKRKAHKFNLRDTAKHLNIAYGYLCDIEQSRRPAPNGDFVERISAFLNLDTPLSDSRFAWCLDFSPQPTVAFLNLAGQRKYTTCSMDSKLHFGPFADEEGHTIPFPGSLRR